MRTVGPPTENVMVEVQAVDGRVELFATTGGLEPMPLSPAEAREVAGAIMLAAYEAERKR